MKLRIAFGVALTVLTIAAILTTAAMAQSTKPEMSQLKSRQDPATTSNRPITPKSAMPQQRRSPVAASKASSSNDKANAELNSMERQKTVASKPAAAPQIRLKTSQSKPAATSSDINASYQKPNPKKN